jgi:hypothetical protein
MATLRRTTAPLSVTQPSRGEVNFSCRRVKALPAGRRACRVTLPRGARSPLRTRERFTRHGPIGLKGETTGRCGPSAMPRPATDPHEQHGATLARVPSWCCANVPAVAAVAGTMSRTTRATADGKENTYVYVREGTGRL